MKMWGVCGGRETARGMKIKEQKERNDTGVEGTE